MDTGTALAAADSVCVGWLTVENGKQISIDNSQVCVSNHTFTQTISGKSTTFCMKGDISTDNDPTSSFSTGTKCNFTHFVDPSSPQSRTPNFDIASCGFNQANYAYCNQRKGDPDYLDYLTTL